MAGSTAGRSNGLAIKPRRRTSFHVAFALSAFGTRRCVSLKSSKRTSGDGCKSRPRICRMYRLINTPGREPGHPNPPVRRRPCGPPECLGESPCDLRRKGDQTNLLTPHPGPLPIEGRGSRAGARQTMAASSSATRRPSNVCLVFGSFLSDEFNSSPWRHRLQRSAGIRRLGASRSSSDHRFNAIVSVKNWASRGFTLNSTWNASPPSGTRVAGIVS